MLQIMNEEREETKNRTNQIKRYAVRLTSNISRLILADIQ